MVNDIHIIVGDSYRDFSEVSPYSFTVSEFIEGLEGGHSEFMDSQVIVGQGMEKADYESLIKVLKDKGSNRVIDLGLTAPVALTHKKFDSNVLVTAPRKLEEKHYEFDLYLMDEIDRLSDHVTGQHIGGMILMEAARQAGTVAVELEFATGGEELGFILNRFDTEFFEYAFPLPTKIDLKMIELEDPKCTSIEIAIRFFQADKEVCKVDIGVKLLEKSVLKVIESKKAKATIDKHIESHKERDKEAFV